MVNFKQLEEQGFFEGMDKRSKEYKVYKKWKELPKESEDTIIWRAVKERLSSTMSRAYFKIMCKLHAKHFDHKYKEICTCSKSTIRQWIFQLNDKLL